MIMSMKGYRGKKITDLKEYKIPEFKEYREFVADELKVDIKKVVPGAEFIQDLGADSLDTVVILQKFEDIYGIGIPDHEAENLFTVQKAFDYLKGKVRQKIEYEGKILEAYNKAKDPDFTELKMPDFNEYKKIITETLGVNEDNVKEGSSLIYDLGASSLNMAELLTNLEKKYGIDIPDYDAEKFTDVQKGFEYLKGRFSQMNSGELQ